VSITRKEFLAGACGTVVPLKGQDPQKTEWIRFYSASEGADVRLRVGEIEFWMNKTEPYEVWTGRESFTVADDGPIVQISTKTGMPFSLIGDEAKRFMRLMEECE